LHRNQATTLCALIALEKFALTGTNKERLVDAGAADLLVTLEDKYCNCVGESDGTIPLAPKSADGAASAALERQIWKVSSFDWKKAEPSCCDR
jgi:hypothetical protein